MHRLMDYGVGGTVQVSDSVSKSLEKIFVITVPPAKQFAKYSLTFSQNGASMNSLCECLNKTDCFKYREPNC